MESTKRITAHLCWERTCQRTVGLCHINLRLDKAGSSEKRFSAFSEAQGRPTANRARIWNHDLTYLTSNKQKNPVETSKPPQPAGGPHSKSRAHPARPAVREALVNRLPPIKSGQFCNKNNNQIIIYTSCNDKHAVDQIKSATGIKTDKTWQKN